MKDLNDKDTWFEIETHLKNQAKNKEVIAAMNYLLELGLYEPNLAYSIELTLQDKYDAMVAVYLAINEVALAEEKYEICGLIESAYFKQNNIMLKILEMDNATTEEIWHLEITREYFYSVKHQQANKITITK